MRKTIESIIVELDFLETTHNFPLYFGTFNLTVFNVTGGSFFMMENSFTIPPYRDLLHLNLTKNNIINKIRNNIVTYRIKNYK